MLEQLTELFLLTWSEKDDDKEEEDDAPQAPCQSSLTWRFRPHVAVAWFSSHIEDPS
jgi:hypothetical protein